MHGWRRHLGALISSIYGMRRILAPPSESFRVLMYHAVGSPVSGDIHGLFNMTPERFRQQMAMLSEFAAGRVTQLSELPRRGFAVTFDDGYRDNLECAAPILVNLSIPFTVFVTPEFVLSGQAKYLSVAGLRELIAVPGASVGAHGYTHCWLTECDTHELQEELSHSRKWLEDVLGESVTMMSYPYGGIDKRIRSAVAAAGYRVAASSLFGTNLPSYDPLWLARTDIWKHDDPEIFLAKLKGDWDWLRFRP
ncbi:MAG: polysaccharide deacetylase family protein [Syntrophorhabdaceae bacterium]